MLQIACCMLQRRKRLPPNIAQLLRVRKLATLAGAKHTGCSHWVSSSHEKEKPQHAVLFATRVHFRHPHTDAHRMLSQGKRAREDMLEGLPSPCLLGLTSALGRVDRDEFTGVAGAPSTVRSRLPLSVLRVSRDVSYFEVEVLEGENDE